MNKISSHGCVWFIFRNRTDNTANRTMVFCNMFLYHVSRSPQGFMQPMVRKFANVLGCTGFGECNVQFY